MRPRNRTAVTILILLLLTLGVVTMTRFTDSDTRARLYGWLPGGAPPVQPGSTHRRQS